MRSAMELPLVAFTVLSQLAIGMALLYALRTSFAGAGAEPRGARTEWLVAAALLGLGLLLSLLHLGHPTGAPTALANLATSWLSREALLAALLVALMVATALRWRLRILVWVTAAVGLATIFVQGMVYSPAGYPALHNAFPLAFFLLTAVVLGAGAAAWFASPERQPLVRAVLVGGLAMSLMLYLVVPYAWLSGGTVERLTGENWFASPYYWTHVVAGLALPLAVVLWTRRIPRWLPLLLIAGAVAGRIGFYADTVHAAANMGGLY